MIPIELLMRDDERYCKNCESWKHKEQFIKNHKSRTGYLQTCKKCVYEKRAKKTMREVTALNEIIINNYENREKQFENPIISINLLTGEKSGYGIRKFWRNMEVHSRKYKGE
jgi:hypothetical protein